ncbi:MAG: TetR/AcrR family transcriptional regulator, partial [Halospina sp.]
SHDRVLDGLAAYLRQLAAEATDQVGGTSAPVPACMMVKTLLEATTDTPGLQDAVNDLFDRIERDLTGVLESARDQGELTKGADCARLARLWQAQIIGLRTFAHRRVDAESVKLLAEDMILALQCTT